LERLFSEAASRIHPADRFDPPAALDAAAELQEVVGGGPGFLEITDPEVFYQRYDRLKSNVTAALSIVSDTRQPNVPAAALDVSSFSLSDLSIEVIKEQLPPDFKVSDETLREVVAAIRSGKHILLSGPPGTGKSTLAEATCKAVVGLQFDVATATADWTTFDTIGGYVPHTTGSGLLFEPGIVLRALRTHRWLVIDEINRADIDKAFGPLFSVLSGSDSAEQASVVLPYQEDGERVRVDRIGTDGVARRYTVTPLWRLVGTLNISDKASLFQLSFAFLRRFAVIDVPIPSDEVYQAWIEDALGSLAHAHPDLPVGLLKAATGPRTLGPAIMKDAVSFAIVHHELQTAGAAPLLSVVVALCLFAVPQYEGATKNDTDRFVAAIDAAMPLGDLKVRLKDALSRVSLG
jgi:DNA polymerase III delta prime subunit